MNILDLIEKKKHYQRLEREEIEFFIEGLLKGEIVDYQVSALLMAIYFAGLDLEETTDLTRAIVKSGEVLDLSEIGEDIVDKHSTGGVGDKITLILLPLLAAAGVKVAKLSGRGLGFTGGTIDKLESIPNFKTDLGMEEFIAKVKSNGLAIAAQTKSLTPADGKLYALRDVTGTVDIMPLIASSVVSKKIASGANQIVLDVKYGSGAFTKTKEKAQELADMMIAVGKNLGKEIDALISNMDEPLGRAVGNSLEIIETIEFLKGNCSKDLEDLTFKLADISLKNINPSKNQQNLKELINSGKALEKFRLMVSSQGGNPDIINDYNLLPQAKYKIGVEAPKSGIVTKIDALKIAKACKFLGAGREKKTDAIDFAVGVYLNKKTGENIKENEVIATIHANNSDLIEAAKNMVLSAYEISS